MNEINTLFTQLKEHRNKRKELEQSTKTLELKVRLVNTSKKFKINNSISLKQINTEPIMSLKNFYLKKHKELKEKNKLEIEKKHTEIENKKLISYQKTKSIAEIKLKKATEKASLIKEQRKILEETKNINLKNYDNKKLTIVELNKVKANAIKEIKSNETQDNIRRRLLNIKSNIEREKNSTKNLVNEVECFKLMANHSEATLFTESTNNYSKTLSAINLNKNSKNNYKNDIYLNSNNQTVISLNPVNSVTTLHVDVNFINKNQKTQVKSDKANGKRFPKPPMQKSVKLKEKYIN